MDVQDNVVTEKGEHEARDGRGERWTYGTTL